MSSKKPTTLVQEGGPDGSGAGEQPDKSTTSVSQPTDEGAQTSSMTYAEDMMVLNDVLDACLPVTFRWQRDDFSVLTLTRIRHDPSKAYKDNAKFLVNDYCCICNCLASECTFWTNTKENSRCHCNAFIWRGDARGGLGPFTGLFEARLRTSLFWEQEAVMQQNPLYRYISEGCVEFYLTHYRQVETGMEIARQDFEGVLDTPNGALLPAHQFRLFKRAFYDLFPRTRIVSNELEWKEKTSVLLAMTTVIVKTSFHGVADDFVVEAHHRMIRCLGSRWLTILASCPKDELLTFVPLLRQQVEKFYSSANENIDNGFGVIRGLSKIMIAGEEVNTMRMSCCLLMTLVRRLTERACVLRSPLRGRDRRHDKYCQFVLNDSVLISFIEAVVVDYPCDDALVVERKDGSRMYMMSTIRLHLARAKFYHEPSIDHWNLFVMRAPPPAELLSATQFLHLRLSADYSFSRVPLTRIRELTRFSALLQHIGGEGTPDPPTGRLEGEWRPTVVHYYDTCNPPKGTECPICLGTVKGVAARLHCKHLFHKRCIKKWKHQTCPCCRASTEEPTLRERLVAYAKEIEQKWLTRRGRPTKKRRLEESAGSGSSSSSTAVKCCRRCKQSKALTEFTMMLVPVCNACAKKRKSVPCGSETP